MNRRSHRLPGLLAVALLTLAAAGCSFQISQVAVENLSSQAILVADSQLACNDQPNLKDLPSHTLQPGQRRNLFTFTSKSIKNDCIFVAGTDGKPAAAPLEAKALYDVTETGGALRVARAGDNDQGFDFAGKTPPLWAILLFGLPLAAGALVALWITLSFFYGYYVQGKR